MRINEQRVLEVVRNIVKSAFVEIENDEVTVYVDSHHLPDELKEAMIRKAVKKLGLKLKAIKVITPQLYLRMKKAGILS